jgi:hypothetical protein
MQRQPFTWGCDRSSIVYARGMTGWSVIVDRERDRYDDGLERLPPDADGRQKQLVRVANAAWGAGLAELMQRRTEEAAAWLLRSAEHYRLSAQGAPEGSWGRPIGALKTRLIAGDWPGAREDANWALALGAATAESPIGRYAAVLAHLVLGADAEAVPIVNSLLAESEERFPQPIATALAGLAASDEAIYADGLSQTLRSFEQRDAYLEDVPVADTALVLEALAGPRGLTVSPVSPLLPPA